MSDLVNRLRRNAPCDQADINVGEMCRQAADEIERLRAENEKLLVHLFVDDSVRRVSDMYGANEAKGLTLKERLEHRIENLQAEIEKLQAKCEITYCAYCGAEFPVGDDTTDISNHIATCELHPMRAVEAENERLLEKLKDYNIREDHNQLLMDNNRNLRAEIERLRDMVPMAYDTGFNDHAACRQKYTREQVLAMTAPLNGWNEDDGCGWTDCLPHKESK